MRDGKGVHTINDSCYHKEKGAEKTWGGGDGSKHINGNTTWAHILSDRPVFCTARGGGKTAGSNAPGAFLLGGGWSLAPDLHSVKTIIAGNLRSFSIYSPEFS